ncbi:HipA family kinase [Mobilicoccus massiliensis]|uniref:HipA family kinase n=1 Tax=Mobilicoccus massiliensis TaxID=1522310 RepID=UPI0009E3744D|nr:HipA family kinase [Mobilicoccus massiliensis]
MENVRATRYVLPLREGGSMPGLMEADDDGMYVVKFRGAGQGLKVLVAEVVVGLLGRAIGVHVPELAVVDVDAAIAKYEADEEVQDLLDASLGTNLGLDFLPGSFGYDGSRTPDAATAQAIVWLDAFTANVDRTWQNPNLLWWHDSLVAIDHGAALYFHHSWPSEAPDPGRFARQRFDASTHVLAEVAGPLEKVAARHPEFAALLTPEVLESVVAAVPEEWLETTEFLPNTAAVRAAYVDALTARLAEPAAWLPGAA